MIPLSKLTCNYEMANTVHFVDMVKDKSLFHKTMKINDFFIKQSLMVVNAVYKVIGGLHLRESEYAKRPMTITKKHLLNQ